ncbi:MAG: hypothetical protein MRK02_16580 [Candidatus Scalindua sp.]|nr:hypothetical protein [Candidatus Scalindua sp.]
MSRESRSNPSSPHSDDNLTTKKKGKQGENECLPDYDVNQRFVVKYVNEREFVEDQDNLCND